MITVALSTTIAAPPERVWRALTEPGERAIWDRRILGEVRLGGPTATKAASPSRRTNRSTNGEGRPESSRRWRFRLGGIPLVLREDRIEIDPEGRLASRISIGTLTFDQSLTLQRADVPGDDEGNGVGSAADEDVDAPRTRLGIRIVAGNSVAVVDAVVPRLDVQKLVMEYADATLQQVRAHCEALAAESPRAMPPAPPPIGPTR